ncbi:hypothetical protein R3P38DRAFT_3175586 [Favolaschia claudopus]|uniref:C2H2-type domain-containing protein n=1 Tax=Favolaschia claudopus TaxID=2862362 RepID=A0AAW0D602_9AGAR
MKRRGTDDAQITRADDVRGRRTGTMSAECSADGKRLAGAYAAPWYALDEVGEGDGKRADLPNLESAAQHRLSHRPPARHCTGPALLDISPKSTTTTGELTDVCRRELYSASQTSAVARLVLPARHHFLFARPSITMRPRQCIPFKVPSLTDVCRREPHICGLFSTFYPLDLADFDARYRLTPRSFLSLVSSIRHPHSTMRLGSPISLPSTPKLLSDPYQSAYQRRRAKSMGAESPLLLMRESTLFLSELREEALKSSVVEQWSPANVWIPPTAEELQRLVSELENIQLSEAASGPSSRAKTSEHSTTSRPSTSRLPASRSAYSRSASTTSTSSAAISRQPSESQSTASRPFTSSKPSASTQATQSRACRPKKRTRWPQESHPQAHCPHGFKRAAVCAHGFKRTAVCAHSFKRFAVCSHGFRLASICPHGYAQAASAMDVPPQPTSCRPRYEDSIFEKTVKLFM